MLDLMTSYTLYNTTKTVCMLVRPKQSQGRFSTGVRLGNEELSFVEEFLFLGHIMTADCRDDNDIKNNSGGKMQLAKCCSRSSRLHGGKIQLFKSYCYQIYGCALWHHFYQNSIRKLTVSYSDIQTTY